jgi:hypothetical protein
LPRVSRYWGEATIKVALKDIQLSGFAFRLIAFEEYGGIDVGQGDQGFHR